MSVIIFEQFPDPDAAFVKRDAYGRQLYNFAIEYRMNDVVWAAHIWANSHEDAEDRVQAMRKTLALCGQVFCEVPG